MRRTLIAVILLAASIGVGSASEWPADLRILGNDPLLDFDSRTATKALLPADLKIAPPDASVPAEPARLSGIWNGWECDNRHVDLKVAFISVAASGATALLAWGDNGKRNSFQMEAALNDGEFVGQAPASTVTYYFRLRRQTVNDVLEVKFERNGTLGCFGVLLKQRSAGTAEITK